MRHIGKGFCGVLIFMPSTIQALNPSLYILLILIHEILFFEIFKFQKQRIFATKFCTHIVKAAST